MSISRPCIDGLGRACDFQQNKELLRVGVLSFIENDAIIFLANPFGDIGLTHQLGGERHLVRVSDEAALEAECAIIALHFGRDAERAGVYPFAQRTKRFAPAADEIFCCACAWWPRRKF